VVSDRSDILSAPLRHRRTFLGPPTLVIHITCTYSAGRWFLSHSYVVKGVIGLDGYGGFAGQVIHFTHGVMSGSHKRTAFADLKGLAEIRIYYGGPLSAMAKVCVALCGLALWVWGFQDFMAKKCALWHIRSDDRSSLPRALYTCRATF
jgi:hypothetical protein